MTKRSFFLNNNQSITRPLQPIRSSDSHLTPVYLNLYDLGECHNNLIHALGFAFYHCSIQAHSSEYGYLGHPYEMTGVYKTSKHDSRFHLYKIRHSIEISWTWLNENEIDKLVFDLQPFYLGLDYHTTKKNSIHFAKYLLEQITNDSQLKRFESIQIPSYIDRARRLTETFSFLQMFDTEKEIAEINILYFLYMKFEGNVKQICQILKFDTIEKLKRIRDLIEHGIQETKLPRFPLYLTFNLNTPFIYFYEKNSRKDQLTLTDIFHQFDTITLRGRTSIDRYLNMQHSPNEIEIKSNIESKPFPYIDQTSQAQAISQNQGQTSPSVSFSKSMPICLQLHMHKTKLCLQNPSSSNVYLRRYSSLPRRRKLPRDFELTNNLYKIRNLNFTTINQISFENLQTNEEIDSIV